MVMSTLNISMPEAMRRYIDQQAAAGNYSASEYVRHLIRQDQQKRDAVMDEFLARNRKPIAELLAISAAQLDRGEYYHASAEDVIASGRARRRAQIKKSRKS